MAPKRKTPVAPPAAKKPRANPNFAGVQGALEMADLPDSCRQMLIACIGPVLGVACDERHPLQSDIVAMIGESIEAVRAKLQQSMDVAGDRMKELEGAQSDLDAKVAVEESVLSAASAEVQSKTANLAEAAKALLDAQAGLKEKEAAQSEGDREFNEASAKLSELQKAIVEHFRPLAEGEEGAGESHFAALLPLMKGAGVDESLMNALPSTCSKKPIDRTSFDAMAIEHLGRSLEEKAAAMQAMVDGGAPSAQERAAAVDAAKAALEAAAASQTRCAEQLAASKCAEQEAAAALQAARAAAAARGPELEFAARAREEKQAALEGFVGYSVACFEVLRDTRGGEPRLGEAEAAAAAAGAGA